MPWLFDKGQRLLRPLIVFVAKQVQLSDSVFAGAATTDRSIRDSTRPSHPLEAQLFSAAAVLAMENEAALPQLSAEPAARSLAAYVPYFVQSYSGFDTE